MTELDFLTPLRDSFGPGQYLRAFRLTGPTPDQGGVTVEFTAEQPYAGAFRLYVPLPEKRGDRRWNSYDDLAQTESEWILIGICIPLEEAYYTQALSTPADRDGVKTLTMP
ncbi:hypothetical protein [uncultured Microbacterium sp.]|uniref:hypothetical protein n=1 Tax=uncultured Microbacterium sp. TaxID=191216 RepID=UPI0025DD7724|nr:hypothetical protein [uncultured Microbacterium sp.]